MKGINIFLADGFEDMEALAVNDVLHIFEAVRKKNIDSFHIFKYRKY